jgi:predicted NUDIX family phosphoesterase
LHAKRSLGIGGHVDETDADGRATPEAYEMALRRELDEEVAISSPGTLTRVGLINDDSSPVGAVHLGVVYVYHLERPEVVAREDGLADAGFVSIDDVLAGRDRFETWSQITIDALLAGH